jgi:hypothetical protein
MLGDADPGRLDEAVEAPGGGVAVHASAAGVERDRPGTAVSNGAVDAAADGGRQVDEDGLGAFAAHA